MHQRVYAQGRDNALDMSTKLRMTSQTLPYLPWVDFLMRAGTG